MRTSVQKYALYSPVLGSKVGAFNIISEELQPFFKYISGICSVWLMAVFSSFYEMSSHDKLEFCWLDVLGSTAAFSGLMQIVFVFFVLLMSRREAIQL